MAQADNKPRAPQATHVATGRLKPRQSAMAEVRAAPVPPPEIVARDLFQAAVAAQRAGDARRAEAGYRRALELRPDDAPTLNNLGILLAGSLRHVEAEAALRRAIAIDPGHAGAWDSLGNLLLGLKRHAEAEAAYREAMRLDPGAASARNNLGSLLMDLNRLDESETVFREAIERQPDCAEAHHNLGLLHYRMHKVAEAARAFRHAHALRPDFTQALCKIPHMKRAMCAWDGLDADDAAVLRCVDAGRPRDLPPFALLPMPAATPRHLREAARLRAEHSFQALLSAPPLAPVPVARPGAPLRLGYLSADFQEHATTHLLAGVIEAHDPGRFAVHLYSYGASPDDAYRQRLRNACHRFVDLSRLADADAAQRIADDRIDLLVDLKGFTRNSRLGISARRPAPVIVNWLGYPGSLGHPRLADFLIGDAVVSPLEHAAHFSEALALLPHCYQPNDRDRAIGATPSRAEAGLPEAGFVFASLNQTYKIDPLMFGVWCRLLAAVPGSVLWLLDPKSEEARVNLRRETAARGVDPARLVFAPRLGQAAHLGRLCLADLALDTFPVTSHTTASDALWAGVPLLTRLGETFASRVAASLLRTLGLPELVTGDETGYFDLALALARDPGRLAALRARVGQQRLASPLFDTPRFTRDLERLLLAIWDQACSGRRGHVVLDTPRNP